MIIYYINQYRIIYITVFELNVTRLDATIIAVTAKYGKLIKFCKTDKTKKFNERFGEF
ncbi:hypothetical protein MH1LPH_20680 [Lactiplantibacillus brownii]